MRIVFIGASKFGARCLNTLLTIEGVDVVGAVTAPQKFSISYRPEGVNNVLYADIQSLCVDQNIQCEIIKSGMNDNDLLSVVQSWNPDAFIVAGWYHMVTKRWRDIAPAYGLHASLLPDYSGGAPLVWAMINGEKKTGITFFRLEDGVDSGPIIGQQETAVLPEDTIASLYDRIEELGLCLISKHLPQLVNGTAVLIAQNETQRRLMPQRKPEDGLINWNQSAEKIHDFIRAQTKPYPGAFTIIDGQKITIWDGVPDSLPLKPQCEEYLEDELYIGCGKGDSYRVFSMAVDGIDTDVKDYIAKRTHSF